MPKPVPQTVWLVHFTEFQASVAFLMLYVENNQFHIQSGKQRMPPKRPGMC